MPLPAAIRNLRFCPSLVGRLALVSTVLLAVHTPRGLGQQEDELKRRFIQEAPSQWEQYARISGELQGILTYSSTRTLNDRQYQNRSEYKVNGRGKVLKAATEDRTNGKLVRDDEEVFGFNSRYAFSLLRKSPDSSWVVTNLLKASSEIDLGRVDSQLNDYLSAVNFGVRLDGQPLTEVVPKQEFRIDRCRSVQKDADELVEVSFTYSKPDGNWKRKLIGKLLFDPSRYWSVRSGEVQVTGDFVSGTQKFQLTQSDNAGTLPPLSRVYESDGDWVSSAGWTNHHKERSEATLSQPTYPPADEEFTLSAFGLPEPQGLGNRAIPWYLWAAILGFACLGLAGIIRWRSRGVQSVASRRAPI